MSPRAQASSQHHPIEEDNRPLPLPDPYDKHNPHPPRSRRNPNAWSWQDYAVWLKKAWKRPASEWRNKKLRTILTIRNEDKNNEGVPWHRIHQAWEERSWIYILFHLPTGKPYVGQTCRHIFIRPRSIGGPGPNKKTCCTKPC